jgi:chromosome segregation ATPase
VTARDSLTQELITILRQEETASQKIAQYEASHRRFTERISSLLAAEQANRKQIAALQNQVEALARERDHLAARVATSHPLEQLEQLEQTLVKVLAELTAARGSTARPQSMVRVITGSGALASPWLAAPWRVEKSGG